MTAENAASYEAPQAEIVQVSEGATCISTSVPIDENPPNKPFDPSDIA